MNPKITGAVLAGCLAASAIAQADSGLRRSVEAMRASPGASSFQRIATFANYTNNTDRTAETVSEIVAANAKGTLLVYTDSPGNQIGFVDITNPASPQPAGTLALTGEPTSIDVLGNKYALVAVNTSSDFTNASGDLVVVNLVTKAIVATLALGGQPDAIKISPDRRYAAIAIENERDESLCVGGTSDGLKVSSSTCKAGGGVLGGLPQTPFGNAAGYLAIIDLVGAPEAWTRRDVALTGLAAVAPEDPEPEFVDVNAANRAVVTLQENNHIAIVDLVTGTVTGHFTQGAVSLTQIDTLEKPTLNISLTGSLANIAREADAVAWVPTPQLGNVIATANEGDFVGGSRGFSIFNRSGTVLFDSGNSLDHIAVQHGHYPDDRSENKGNEPEAIEYGSFDGRGHVFVGSERGGFVAVYTMNGAKPRIRQVLPAPFGPEGLLAIPARNLLIVSGENDSPEFGVRSTMMIYQLRAGAPTYPQIVSDDTYGYGTPIPWAALSGMAMLPGRETRMLAVWDSFFGTSKVLRIDASAKPAVIEESFTITGGTGNFDPEGIAIAPDRTLWVASEGNATISSSASTRPNLLIQLDEYGNVVREVGLPAEIVACRDASTARGTLGSGFEGVTVQPLAGGSYRLLVAQQRGWDYTTQDCEALDDDDGGLNSASEPNWSRIWIYDPVADAWTHVHWELAAKPTNSSWVGLSEITYTKNGLVLIERDNRTGDFGALKTLVRIPLATLDDEVVTTAEKSVRDIGPALRRTKGWITDKPEGVAISNTGRVFVVTDNDGVKDWSGETWFLDLGRADRLFPAIAPQ
jgi:hypothetical protein